MAVGVAVDGVALAAAAVDGDGVVGLVLGEALPAREEAGAGPSPGCAAVRRGGTVPGVRGSAPGCYQAPGR